MRTLLKYPLIAIAAMALSAFLAWNAEAITLTGAGIVTAPPQSHSPIEKVACNGTRGRYCGPGQHRICYPDGHCGCVLCGGHGGAWYGAGGGWHNRYWHRGWHSGWRRGWHRGGWHHHFWHHHGHHHGHHHHGHHGGHHRSDMRLKEDIVPLARLDNGLELYRFRYKGSDHTAYVGVMAQEVQKIDPSAVSRDGEGYLMVDYDRLGLDFMTWDEWQAQRSANHQSAH
jgi:Chaperone of endosialidase